MAEVQASAKPVGRACAAKEPWIEVKVDISPSEREIIRTHVHACTTAEGRRKKAKGLPPGLAKEVARGGELPPGWQKKCVRGGNGSPISVRGQERNRVSVSQSSFS